MIVIAHNAVTAPAFAVNGSVLPFITVAAGSSTYPFAVGPIYSPSGPFNGLQNSIINFAVDTTVIDFINLQNKLDVQGKCIVSRFDEAPNNTWLKVTGPSFPIYSTGSITISDQ